MWLHTSCLLEFEPEAETTFLFMLRPRSNSQQWVSREQYLTNPGVHVHEFTDSFGNLCQRMSVPTGHFSISISADVDVVALPEFGYGAPYVPICNLPESTVQFLYPSRFVESDRFNETAISVIDGIPAGYDQCARIAQYIRETIRYEPGEGDFGISAWEVSQRSHAVCRDMAHLGIALCRALTIPARMVVGYLENLHPMDMHAWFEAYVGGRWYTFDPTQQDLSGARVVVAYGRDAADVSLFTQFGKYVPLRHMQVNIERAINPG